MNNIKTKLKYGRFFGLPYRIWTNSETFRIEALRFIDNPTKNSTPVFLVGCGRSGTNMLSAGLASTYQIQLYNEDNPAAFEDWRIKNFEEITRLNLSGHARIKLYKPILDTHLSCKFLSSFDTAKLIFIFRHFTDVIKSSINHFGQYNWSNRVKRWIKDDFAEFSNAPIQDVTKSSIRSIWSDHLSPESTIALYWLFYNRLYFDLNLRNHRHVILVNYETIVNQPIPEFQKICNFLEIKYSRQMTEGIHSSSVKQSPNRHINKTIRDDCDDLWEMLCEDIDG